MSTSRGCTIIFVQFVHIIVILPHSHSHSSNKNRSVPLSFSPALWWCRLPCVFFCARGLKRPEAAFSEGIFPTKTKVIWVPGKLYFQWLPVKDAFRGSCPPVKGCFVQNIPPPLRDWKIMIESTCLDVMWITRNMWDESRKSYEHPVFFPKLCKLHFDGFSPISDGVCAKGSLRKAYFVRNSSILYLPPFA